MVYVGIAYETTLIKISFPTLESNFSFHPDNFVADFVGFYKCEWSVRFPWRIKDVRIDTWWPMDDALVNQKKNPLGKGAHIVVEIIGFYTCEWSPTLNNDEKNEWLI